MFLARYGLAPSKRFGQNFLVNPRTAKRIVGLGGFSKTDHVVEVGVGFGALTSFLSEAAGTVTGIEIDKGLVAFHKAEQDLPENVTLLHGDVLKINFSELRTHKEEKLKIIANLPYSISNPFIFKLIDNSTYIDAVTVMLQKEVADRLTASPGSKNYGIPTIILGSIADVKHLITLKPPEFYPKPKIDSVVIK